MLEEMVWCQRCEQEGRFTPVAIMDGDEPLCYKCYQGKHHLGPPEDVYHRDITGAMLTGVGVGSVVVGMNHLLNLNLPLTTEVGVAFGTAAVVCGMMRWRWKQ